LHKQAGADSVMLVAPDQMVLQTKNSGLSLRTLAHRYFPDVDIVIGEGFKTAKKIPKIEVFMNCDQKLRDEVHGVIAVATNIEGVAGNYVFRLDEAAEIALFIEKRFLTGKDGKEVMALLVNGDKIPLKDFIQEALAETVYGFVKTLKCSKDIKQIELRIKVDDLGK
jgi:molybdopterin-guanine dinucleotide biosynthesis protein B